MSETTLLILLVGIAIFALFSKLFDRRSITAPMFFTLIGLLSSPVLLAWTDISLDDRVVHVLAEITLILVLFTDAAHINLKHLRTDHDLPVRMLLVGMPLTILLGALVSLWIFPQLLLIEAIILAIILAPTDAALGQTVVSSPQIPERIRQTLNVESGINDGIAFPALLFALSLATISHDANQNTNWIQFVSLQLILGPVVGIVLGWIGAKAINLTVDRRWHSMEFCNIFLLCLAFIIYLIATEVGGNGFIAAFVGGIVVGNTLTQTNNKIYEFSASEGQLLNLVIFFLFGAIMVPKIWYSIEWQHLIYSLISLTLVRMIPVFISIIDKHLRWETVLFLGWFGPRGLASILFTLLVIDHVDLPGEMVIFNTVILTVLFSIILHGLTALPGVNLYARALKTCSQRGDDLSSEMKAVGSVSLRSRKASGKER